MKIHYIVSDLLKWDATTQADSFDLVYMEGGILHYFDDLAPVADLVQQLLRPGGRLVLSDFHPFRKCIKEVREGESKGQEEKEARRLHHGSPQAIVDP